MIFKIINWYRKLIDNVLDEKPFFSGGYHEGKYKAFIFLPPLVLLFIIIISLAVFFSNFNSHKRNWSARLNTNEIFVVSDSLIKRDSIKIEWKNSYPCTKIVFYNGRQIKTNINERGYNYFIVSYLGQRVNTYKQFKSDHWSYHKYLVTLEMDSNDTPQSTLQIEGEYRNFKDHAD